VTAPEQTSDLTGIVLAGGAGRRMGGDKALAAFRGRPLIEHPLAALAAVCDRVAVVCKDETLLPELPSGVERWDEPPEPRHPIAGITYALERAGTAIVVCAADMPFVTPEALRSVAAPLESGARAVVAIAAGVPQPVLAAYAPAALGGLRAARSEAALTETVLGLDPVRVEVDAAIAVSIDTPEALAAAEEP
jgi:molybdopterin-guanine dinucleotide biosynthesis protein A